MEYNNIPAPYPPKNHTDNRAENNLGMSIVRRAEMPAWQLGHQWSGDDPGARLRQARLAKGMTIRDLAKAVGITPEAISYLEAGKSVASLPNMRKLAQALGVPIAYLGCYETLPENTLGQRITKARLYHGLTKEEMASAIGVDPKTLRSWEQDLHRPRPEHVARLKHYLMLLDQ